MKLNFFNWKAMVFNKEVIKCCCIMNKTLNIVKIVSVS